MQYLGFVGTKLTPAQAETLCKALWHFSRFCTFLRTLCNSEAERYAADYWLQCGGQVWCHGKRDERCAATDKRGTVVSIIADSDHLLTTDDIGHGHYINEEGTTR